MTRTGKERKFRRKEKVCKSSLLIADIWRKDFYSIDRFNFNLPGLFSKHLQRKFLRGYLIPAKATRKDGDVVYVDRK